MRKLHLFAALAALALCCAAPSHGSTVANNGGRIQNRGDMTICYVNGSDTTCIVAQGDPTTGAAYMMDVDRDRDKVTLFQDAIVNASLAIGTADSSANLNVHSLRYLKLLIKANTLPAGGSADTGAIVRLAFQFREMMNNNPASDTASTFAEYQGGQSPMGVNITGSADTSLTGHTSIGNAGVPWAGEYVVEISAKRTGTGQVWAVNGRVFSYPNGLSIPLDAMFGRPARFDYLSIRVRNLGSNTTAGSAPCKVAVHLLGFAQ